MKHLFAALAVLALMAFSVPAFACDGHKSADKDPDVTTAKSGEKADDGHACTADCDHEGKAKKANSETTGTEGEV